MVISICKRVNASEYLSGPAAKEYILEERFKERGIKLLWHDFQPPKYGQLYGEFVPYMSTLDLLFNEGKESSKIIWPAHEF